MSKLVWHTWWLLHASILTILQRHLHILHLAASKMDCNFWASIMLPLIFSLPPMKACIPSSLPSAMDTKSASAIVMVQSLQPVEFKPLTSQGSQEHDDQTRFNYLKSEFQVFYVTWRDRQIMSNHVKSCNHVKSQDVQWTTGDSSDSAGNLAADRAGFFTRFRSTTAVLQIKDELALRTSVADDELEHLGQTESTCIRYHWIGICAFRHLHNNDNAHSFSLRSSAPEIAGALQGHCRGIAAALQGRCKEYRLANK